MVYEHLPCGRSEVLPKDVKLTSPQSCENDFDAHPALHVQWTSLEGEGLVQLEVAISFAR